MQLHNANASLVMIKKEYAGNKNNTKQQSISYNLHLNVLKRVTIWRQALVHDFTPRIQSRIHTRDPDFIRKRTRPPDLVISDTQLVMRDPDSWLNGAGGRVLETPLDELLAGLGLQVDELVVDVVEEVGGGHGLVLHVADGRGDVVEAVLEGVGDEVERILAILVLGHV